MNRTMSYLGTLGDRRGVNVARVEVGWHFDTGSGFLDDITYETGYYLVHATGDEPECQGEDGTIYNVFEGLVHAAMQERQKRLGFDSYEIDDISST